LQRTCPNTLVLNPTAVGRILVFSIAIGVP
jgi:hypothetical protein